MLIECTGSLSAIMQESAKSADAAHADAMNIRNKQYQKLHGDYQKLSADFAAKRQLASSQATQLLQLQVLHALPPPRISPKAASATSTPSDAAQSYCLDPQPTHA